MKAKIYIPQNHETLGVEFIAPNFRTLTNVLDMISEYCAPTYAEIHLIRNSVWGEEVLHTLTYYFGFPYEALKDEVKEPFEEKWVVLRNGISTDIYAPTELDAYDEAMNEAMNMIREHLDDHGDTFATIHSHCKGFTVKVGSDIKAEYTVRKTLRVFEIPEHEKKEFFND